MRPNFFDPLVTILVGFHCIIMRREMIKQKINKVPNDTWAIISSFFTLWISLEKVSVSSPVLEILLDSLEPFSASVILVVPSTSMLCAGSSFVDAASLTVLSCPDCSFLCWSVTKEGGVGRIMSSVSSSAWLRMWMAMGSCSWSCVI